MEKTFELFGPAHLVAILGTFLVAVGLAWVLRQRRAQEMWEKRVRVTLGVLLLTAVALDPVLTLIRFGSGEEGWDLVVDSSLPLYLCDVVSVLLAFALFTKNQRLAEIGYLWGLAGTVQGLLTPTLWYGPKTLEFYVFFLQHGGVPVAAIVLVWGMGLVPAKGAFLRGLYWSWAYMGIVMGINAAIGRNYGFLNGLPEVPTLFDYMGPYPYYLVTLQAVAFLLYYMLLKLAPAPLEPSRC